MREFGLNNYRRSHFRKDQDYTSISKAEYRWIQRRIAFLVGMVAFLLPLMLLTAAMFEVPATKAVKDICFYWSLSHFYHAPFWGTVFVGALVMVGVMLFFWRGDNRAEGRWATVAGISALGVAFYPTAGTGCSEDTFSARALVQIEGKALGIAKTSGVEALNPFFTLFDKNPLTSMLSENLTVHYVSAAVLFFAMFFMTFFIFRRVDERHTGADKKRTDVKKIRDLIYSACALAMVFCMVALGLYALKVINNGWWEGLRLTFWFEAIFLWSFGLAWMVKGRFLDRWLIDDSERS